MALKLWWALSFITGLVIGKVAADELSEYGVFLNATELSYGLELDSYGYGVSKDAAHPLMIGLTLIQSAASKGAVCLDGSLPGYHIDHGYGSGARSWLIQLEGGGWCNTVRNCVYRKKSRRGSSMYMEKQIPFIGILSNSPQENPDFFNWNRVKVRYCDGASFAGDSYDQVHQLQFRGQRIWLAAMEELMSKGMRYANQALLSGCSAGGLASILHFHFSGLFLDAVDVSGDAASGAFSAV